MKKNPPTLAAPELTLPISLNTYQQLLVASAKTSYRKEIWEIGAAAIHDWLARNEPEAFGKPQIRGYQWKQVFLPNGTLLRTSFGGDNFYCLVENDQMIYNGTMTSPSKFANCVGGVRRNAWKVIWVLFPNTTAWKPAAVLRERRTRRESRIRS